MALPLEKALRLTILMLTLPHPRQLLIVAETGCSIPTVVKWEKYCRDVYMYWCMLHKKKIGGPGKTVELDEAKFGKWMYHRGRVIKGQWVLGGIERGTREAFYVPVPQRDAKTLQNIIVQWVHPETTIMTDCWKGYNGLDQLFFKHLTVNHSLNFVDPETRAHTQNIERSWRDVRGNIPRFGRKPKNFPGYLAQHLFRKAYPVVTSRLHHFLRAVSDDFQ